MKNSQQIAANNILKNRSLPADKKRQRFLDNVSFIYIDGFIDKCYKVSQDTEFMSFKTSKLEGGETFCFPIHYIMNRFNFSINK